ncbi:hypothetical protein APF79_10725 [bacterium BRH_c32]|nr:MAG: hypothetical protein APF79_10725 [bacterium BRH_c32]
MEGYFLNLISRIVLIAVICTSMISAQNKLSGNIDLDRKISFDNTYSEQKPLLNEEMKKSPFVAGLLSLAVPGAGQLYSESYIKGAAFLILEAAAVYTGLVYDRKGDDQTNVFQDYANQHWDVKKYAKWTVTNASKINESVNTANYNVFDNTGNVNWNELNRLENAISAYYSHKLAPLGDQQYFEMIGKYPQFNPGWDDFGDENTPYAYGDPLTPRFHIYSGKRGKANDYYNVASKAVIVIIINHIISTVDAIFTTKSFNKKIELNTDLQKVQFGFVEDLNYKINLRVRF